ncbi:MAG: serine/threonine protein kinase [Acidobacteria bacterium]|nr:serine/threonine protein kinase [Acidobacteriota bacterium]
MPISAIEEADLFARLVELEDTDRVAVLAEFDLDEESRARLLALLGFENGAEDELGLSVSGAMREWSLAGVLEAGMRVGRFEVVRELGRGGMGEVWMVEFEEQGVRRRGALKVLRRHLMEPDQAALWDRERRLVARLSHPYIAGMIESGTLEGGMPFLLMEYVEGRRLDDAVEGMPIAGRVEVMRKVCDAVAAAHRQMVVHRDLKPGNVLITSDGLPKLVDFGIGQALDLGQSYLGAGTRAYSSPEQLAGEEPTMAMDVFSLGRMLERVAGEGGEELGSIARKATASAVGERYETVGELEADLGRWLEKKPVRAFGDGVGYRLRCLVRRQPWVTVGGAVAVGLTFVALVVAWKQYEQAQKRAADLQALAGVAIFDLDEEVRKLQGSLKARQMLLETATKYLANLEVAAKGNAVLRAELADAYLKTSALMSASSAQSLEREDDSFDLAEKGYRLREELGQFDAKDPKIRKGYADSARDYAQKLRLKRRIAESDKIAERAQQHIELWVMEEPKSWQALDHFLFLENNKTRRLRLKGIDLAKENQQKVVARLPELKQLGAPERSYWRQMVIQNSLMAGVMGGVHKLAPEILDSMTKAVQAAEQLYRIEQSVLTTRLLLTTYLEYVEYTVDVDMVIFGENERLIRRSEEILRSPELPDKDAAFWEQHRLEFLIMRGWAAYGRKDDAEMGRWFAECRAGLDRVEPKPFWVHMRRGQIGNIEKQAKERK